MRAFPTARAATRSARCRARSACSRTPCSTTTSSTARSREDAEARGAAPGALVGARSRRSPASIERSIAELGAISDQVLESATHLAEAADRASQPHRRRHLGLGRSLRQRPRHRLGGRRAGRLGDGDRPPGGAVERHRRKGGRRGRAHQRGGAGAERGGQAHRRRGQPDHRHRRADQSAGAQRHHRGGARRRGRPRLCRGGGRGQGAGRPDRQGHRGHRQADRRHAARDQPLDRGDRRRSRAPSATSARSAARSRRR